MKVEVQDDQKNLVVEVKVKSDDLERGVKEVEVSHQDDVDHDLGVDPVIGLAKTRKETEIVAETEIGNETEIETETGIEIERVKGIVTKTVIGKNDIKKKKETETVMKNTRRIKSSEIMMKRNNWTVTEAVLGVTSLQLLQFQFTHQHPLMILTYKLLIWT